MAPIAKVSRKRASSDQLREQANRNMRPAKGKSIAKSRGDYSKGSNLQNRQEGSSSSSQRPSSPDLPPPIPDITLSDSSEYQQQESSTTDDEEEQIYVEEGQPEQSNRKGSKSMTRDARTMAAALAAARTNRIKVVGWHQETLLEHDN